MARIQTQRVRRLRRLLGRAAAAAVGVTTGLSVGPAGQAVGGGLFAATVAAALGGRGSGARRTGRSGDGGGGFDDFCLAAASTAWRRWFWVTGMERGAMAAWGEPAWQFDKQR